MTLPGLIPETDLERSLLADRAVLDGLARGAPRDGHPERTVAHHVESMLARIARDDPDREALRVLALVHDAGKYLVVRAGRWSAESDHALLARRLLARHSDDRRLLDAVELHDEPYWRWKTGRTGDGHSDTAFVYVKALAVHLWEPR